MSLFEISALVAAMAILAPVPSTSVALVVARSTSAEFSNGMAVTAGIVVGDLVFVFLAVFGMVALAEVAGSFFLILRYLAGVYLFWLDARTLTAHFPDEGTQAKKTRRYKY